MHGRPGNTTYAYSGPTNTKSSGTQDHAPKIRYHPRDSGPMLMDYYNNDNIIITMDTMELYTAKLLIISLLIPVLNVTAILCA